MSDSSKGVKTGLGTLDPVADLLKQAEEHVDRFEYDVALQFCQRALDMNNKSLAALEMAASLFLEVGDLQKAKLHLESAVQLNPSTGHSKYLSLAQLNEGNDALMNYRKGVEIITNTLESLGKNSEEEALLQRELSDAYCSISEIYTTDLCDESNSEEQCLENIQKAISADPNNPEAYLCMTSYLLLKEKKTEAKEMLDKSLTFWYPQIQAIFNGNADQAVDPVEFCVLPYNSRVTTVKLLIELESFEVASDILEALLSENDEDVEVWYLSGLMNYLRGEDYKSNARYYLKKTQKVALKIEDVNPEISAHVSELLEELGPGNPEDDDESSDEDKENVNNGDNSCESLFGESDEDDIPMET